MIENETYLRNYQDILAKNPTSIIFHDYRTDVTAVKPWGEKDCRWGENDWREVNKDGDIIETDKGGNNTCHIIFQREMGNTQ